MGKYLSGVLNDQARRVNNARVRRLAKISVTVLMVTLLSFVGQGGGGLAGGSGVLAASRSSATPSSVAPCLPCVLLCRAGRSSRVVPSQCFVQFHIRPSSSHYLCSFRSASDGSTSDVLLPIVLLRFFSWLTLKQTVSCFTCCECKQFIADSKLDLFY